MEVPYHNSQRDLPYLVNPFHFNIHLDIEALARLEKFFARNAYYALLSGSPINIQMNTEMEMKRYAQL
jgi:hypothetical protein